MTRMTHFIKVLSMLEFVIPTKMKSLFFIFEKTFHCVNKAMLFTKELMLPVE